MKQKKEDKLYNIGLVETKLLKKILKKIVSEIKQDDDVSKVYHFDVKELLKEFKMRSDQESEIEKAAENIKHLTLEDIIKIFRL